jgi:hypothetical protein
MCGAALLLVAMVLGTGAPAVALGGHVALYREAVEWLPPWHWPAACTEAYSLNTFSWDRQGALHWGFAEGGGGGGGGGGSGAGGSTLGSLAAGGEAWRMGVVMQSGGCEHGLAMAAADAAAVRAAAAVARLASCEGDTAQRRQCSAEVGEEAAAAGAAALKAQKRVADIKLGTRIWWRAAAAAAFAAQPSIAATAGATTSGAAAAATAPLPPPPPPVRQPRVLLSLPWVGLSITMSDVLDALCLGMILIGCYEAAKDLWQQHEAGEYQAIMAVGAAMAASGRRYNRVLAIGGFAWAVRDAHRRVHDFTMAYVQKAHEFVLAVRASDVPASAT